MLFAVCPSAAPVPIQEITAMIARPVKCVRFIGNSLTCVLDHTSVRARASSLWMLGTWHGVVNRALATQPALVFLKRGARGGRLAGENVNGPRGPMGEGGGLRTGAYAYA